MVLLYTLWFFLRVYLVIYFSLKQKDKMSDTSILERYRVDFVAYDPVKTTLSAIVNLQKVQCGFLLALDVAILVASRSETALGAVSTADLKVNIRALRLLLVGGTLLPVLTQYLLQHLHRSRGLFSLSVFTALCSFIVQHAVLKPRKWTFVPETEGSWMTDCGGKSPINFCDPGSSPDSGFSLLMFHFFVFLVLVVGVIIAVLCHYTQDRNFFNVTWPLFDVAFIIFLSVYASLLPSLRNQNTSIVDQSGWSLGQVIAVTLWAPLVIEWCYGMLSMLC